MPTKKLATIFGDFEIKVVFPDSIKDIIRIKTIQGRKYITDEPLKYWTVPLSIENLETLVLWGFQLDEILNSFLIRKKKKTESLKISLAIPGLKGTLRPFQTVGVSFMNFLEGRALIADEMGLGKTVQGLAYLQLHPELLPAIIIVPSSVKINWQREITKWTTIKKVQILSGQKTYKLTGDIIIINYDIVSFWIKPLIKYNAKFLLLDEGHRIKSDSAKRTKAVKKLGKSIKRVSGLTGTPIENFPIEIYNLVNLIDPTLFPSAYLFKKRYCGPTFNGFGWDYNGHSNEQELFEKLQKVMIRRFKKDVLPELPDKVHSIIPLEISNKEEYRKANTNFLQYIRDTLGEEFDNDRKTVEIKLKEELKEFMEKYDIGEIEVGSRTMNIEKAKIEFQEEGVYRKSKAEVITKIAVLRQIALRGKMDQVIEWIKDFLESGEKLVVFAIHTFVIDMVTEAFPKISVKVNGSVTGKKRQDAIDRFQSDPKCKLFCGQIIAAGEGINLTAASNLVHLELPWNASKLDQASDRIHRMPQRKACNIWYLIAMNTIEEKFAEIIDNKRKVSDKVLTGKKSDPLSLLQELISEYESLIK